MYEKVQVKWADQLTQGLNGSVMGELVELAVNSSLEEEGGTATMATHLYSRPTTVFAAVAASLFTVVGVIGNQSPYL